MLTLHKYISRELLRAFSLAFLVLMLIIFVGFALRYIHEGLDIIEMKFVFPHLALQSFPYCVPLALLIAVIMTFGRMAGDNEITALRSNGIHLQMIVTPTMLIAVLFSVFSFFVISSMVPRSERKIKEIMLDAKTWTRALKILGRSARRIRLQGWLIYVVDQDEEGVYHGISIYRVSQEFVSEMYDAKRGRIDIPEESSSARIHLEDGIFTKASYDHPDDVKTIHFRSFDVCIPIAQGESTKEHDDPKFLSLSQLRKSRAALLERIEAHPQRFDDPLAAREKWAAERDKIDVENGKVSNQLVDHRKSLERLQREEEKSKRELEESELSRKELAARVAGAKKDWQRLKQKQETETTELERKREEQRKLIEKLKPADGDAGGSGSDEPAGDGDGEDAKLLRTLRRDIAGLADNLLRLDREVATAKDAYDAARGVLKDLDARVSDLNSTLDGYNTLRGGLLITSEELKKQLSKGREEREVANGLSCQAAEQQKEYELRMMTNERIALSFSCLAFVLAAVPLGIYSRHGHVLIAFSIGLGLVLAYFGLFLVGRTLAQSRYVQCEAAIWGANAGMGLLGLALLISVFRK